MSDMLIPDLDTAIANAASSFRERRVAAERAALAFTDMLDNPLQHGGGAAGIKANAEAAYREVRALHMHEQAARSGYLLRTQSGTESDLMSCDPAFQDLYAEAQKYGRVRTMKSPEAEATYLADSEYAPQTLFDD